MGMEGTVGDAADRAEEGFVDDETLAFMQKTMARVEKMRANTTVQQEKKEALRAGLSDAEKESVKEIMEEVAAAPPANHLDHSAMLQEQVKIRNFKS